MDLLVTQFGVSVPERNPDLKERLKKAGLPVVDIRKLCEMAVAMNGVPDGKIRKTEKIVANVLNRDGSLLDRIYQVAVPKRESL